MTIIKNISTAQFYFDFFGLTITERYQKIHMEMTVNPNIVTTTQVPCVQKILSKELPGIFSTKCFNYKNQSFYDEVANTEVGHLLEHIILEKFCDLKSRLGYKNFTIRGNTQWDWYTNPKGTFFITLNVKKKDRAIFYHALRESILLYNYIMNTCIDDHHVVAQTLFHSGTNQNKHKVTESSIHLHE